MTAREFVKNQIDKSNWPKDDIFPPPTEAQEGLYTLIHHFLGDDWYCVNPIHTTQINTEAIAEILIKYPGKKERKLLYRLKHLFIRE